MEQSFDLASFAAWWCWCAWSRLPVGGGASQRVVWHDTPTHPVSLFSGLTPVPQPNSVTKAAEQCVNESVGRLCGFIGPSTQRFSMKVSDKA